ncbi:hypothetical protein [Microcoleus sp. D2_18a_D3]|uniref:hypothetical protein n=1 Tax=Microcoleus sp. D2_18a_D3 TaxID=3055330 RepID=UPI002FCE9163
MRYIIVKAETNADGTLSFLGVHQLIQKGSKKSLEWIDVKSAVSNMIDPDQCDFLSFDNKDDAETLVETLDSETENVAVFEIDAD